MLSRLLRIPKAFQRTDFFILFSLLHWSQMLGRIVCQQIEESERDENKTKTKQTRKKRKTMLGYGLRCIF